MAVTNLTDNATQKSFAELYCSKESTGGLYNHLLMFSVIHTFLAITAIMGNSLILLAFHREASLHPPSKLLFRCLAITDLCVGLIVEPVFVTYFTSVLNERWAICRHAFDAFHIIGYALACVSLFTLTAISVDRLFALLLRLRYRQVVTLKRIYLTVALSWVVSTIGSIVYIWNNRITLWFGYIVIALCLVTSMISYTKIFLALRQNQVQAHGQINQGQTSQRFTQYRKTVSSALWVQLMLVFCYTPHGIVEILILRSGLSPLLIVARTYSVTLVFLNSSLNPILYCWKIREVRQAVKDLVKNLFCSST